MIILKELSESFVRQSRVFRFSSSAWEAPGMLYLRRAGQGGLKDHSSSGWITAYRERGWLQEEGIEQPLWGWLGPYQSFLRAYWKTTVKKNRFTITNRKSNACFCNSVLGKVNRSWVNRHRNLGHSWNTYGSESWDVHTHLTEQVRFFYCALMFVICHYLAWGSGELLVIEKGCQGVLLAVCLDFSLSYTKLRRLMRIYLRYFHLKDLFTVHKPEHLWGQVHLWPWSCALSILQSPKLTIKIWPNIWRDNTMYFCRENILHRWGDGK